MTKGVLEGKFELDSLCAVMKLSYAYWNATRDASVFRVHAKFPLWGGVTLGRVAVKHRGV